MTEERRERIKRLEQEGFLDPNCPTCQDEFYPWYLEHDGGSGPFAPSHKPLSSCKSGKRPHCTCDSCF
jgi:hypothetical protein